MRRTRKRTVEIIETLEEQPPQGARARWPTWLAITIGGAGILATLGTAWGWF